MRPANQKTGRDIRRAVLALLAETYAADPDGPILPADWLAGPYGSMQWSPAELGTAVSYIAVLFLELARESDAAQAGGAAADVAGLLDRHTMMMILSTAGKSG